MLSTVPNLISTLWKRPPSLIFSRRPVPPPPPNLHLMMSGIYQNVFLSQWGRPEFQIGLGRLAGFFRLDFLFFDWDRFEAGEYSAWIYEKRNRILFFRNKRLISHFRWDEFKEKWKRPKQEVDAWLAQRSRPPLISHPSYIN